MNEGKTYFVRRLEGEIRALDQKIITLEQERDVLRRQLAKAKAEDISVEIGVRRNSFSRVIAWDLIVKTLQASQGPVSSGYLFEVVRSINQSLNHSTFRTYLNRMKEKGIIRKSSVRGSWQLTNNNKSKLD